MTKYVICEHCGNKIEVEGANAESYETINCPQCESDTYVNEIYDSDLDENSEEFDVEEELKFD